MKKWFLVHHGTFKGEGGWTKEIWSHHATIQCLSKMGGHDIIEFSTRNFSKKKERAHLVECAWPLPLKGKDKIDITFEGEEMDGLKRLWKVFRQL